MESGGFRGVTPHIFPPIGPAILVSMEYVDLGKWMVAIEGGACFGFELVLPVLIFNCIAILCQHLSTGIGLVTRKNLAEICSEEYPRLPCILLGVQAELSIIISNLTMVLGIAYGLNLLFGMDLLSSILFAILGAILLPFLFKLWDTGKAAAFFVCISGFALLFYVFGVLISQPEVPFLTKEFLPNFTGENAYSVMALLGANIIPHNFYTHSAIVQQQARQSYVAMGALFHDHFFGILFFFTGIFIVNYVVITSAAAVFGNTDVVALNFEDVSLVMEQIFKNPIAPVAFLLLLFFSCQITALTRNVGSQVILQHFFATKLSTLVYHMLSKAFTAMLAFYCAKIGGGEGTYQSLITSQIILAMLLPSTTIPLFRVASSRFIMGAFKISWYIEIMALLALFLMITTNVIFFVEILSGNGSWAINLRETNGSGINFFYIFVLFSFSCICFTIYLAITPLKSASSLEDTQILSRISQKDIPEFFEGVEANLENINDNEDMESMAEGTSEEFLESQSVKSTIEFYPELSQTTIGTDLDPQQSTYSSKAALDVTSPTYYSVGSASMVEEKLSNVKCKDSFEPLHDEESFHQQTVFEEPVSMNFPPESRLHIGKDNEDRNALASDEFIKDSYPPLIPESPKPVNSVKGTTKEGGNGSGGSLSKLPGLGRAGRRQFATILDEFWGNLFDFHGKLTQDACSNRLDILLGLEFKATNSFCKADIPAVESSKFSFPDADLGQFFLSNSREYSSPKQLKVQGVELPFGVRMGTSSWSHNMQHGNTLVQSSRSNMFDPAERTYSSLHLPHCADDRDYQPATIHGYQTASGLKGISTGRSTYSISSQNLPPTTKFTTSYASPLREQFLYGHVPSSFASMGTSSLQNPALSRINTLQVERPYFERHLMATSDRSVPHDYTKKYHSSPDISAIIASERYAYLNEGKQNTPICPQTSFGRMVSEQSPFLNPLSRSRVPLAFDELSPSNVHNETFPFQKSLNPADKSLFSRQPFEELFGMVGKDQGSGDVGNTERSRTTAEESFPYADSETKLLSSLKFCIMKLLKLDGSDWLFRHGGGADEKLIDQVAAAMKFLYVDSSETSQPYGEEFQYLPSDRKLILLKGSEEFDLPCHLALQNCGDGCIWRAALVVSFGVWCIQRILELLLVESRPELWGKYTYVLNRLQGVIDPAFFKLREPLGCCSCLNLSIKCQTNPNSLSSNGILCARERESQKSLTSASMILDLIKDVETAVSNRKGRTGTAAGDVAFPKGKENLASVLKRYKRRLSSKPQ